MRGDRRPGVHPGPEVGGEPLKLGVGARGEDGTESLLELLEAEATVAAGGLDERGGRLTVGVGGPLGREARRWVHPRPS